MGSKAKNRRASTPQVWRRCTSGAPSGDELPSPDLSVCCEPAINWSCLVHTAPPGQKNGPTGPNWVEAGRFLAEPAPYWVEHARDWDETAQVFAEPALTRVDSAPKSVKPVPSSVESARRCRPEMGRTSCGQLARAGEVWRQSAPQSKEQRWLDPATTLCRELPYFGRVCQTFGRARPSFGRTHVEVDQLNSRVAPRPTLSRSTCDSVCLRRRLSALAPKLAEV